ncbi:MAG: aldo/keto reductase [Coriobacteriia bacterium]|nr:aldo/keto reductase [Coriobacteriia bacterium]MCL2870266.1 aldo/keto reductase [Coriobacteriia bacterium]
MQYRIDKTSGNKLSILGLGCMRFSRDKAETERMILTAIKNGVNYFDTAYIYPGSEKTLGEILAKHSKRKSVHIATKLPLMMCKRPEDFDQFFNESLRRLQTEYIDYYFMHNISSYTQWRSLQEMGIEDWIANKKKSGEIRSVGFSYHGTSEDFPKILDTSSWEFCMIQYNYSDENYQAGKAGLKAAAEKGLTVMIMEPLLGGVLATGLPGQAVELFKQANSALSPADWAFRWLWSQEEIVTVLSGMNTTEQMESNIQAASQFEPLSDKEMTLYDQALKLFKESYKINCTSCNYCLPCPKGINIPACLSAYNTSYVQSYSKGMQLYLTSTAATTKNPYRPHLCNQCGKCEKACPQNISIRKSLKKVGRRFEPQPLRAILSLAQRTLFR